MDLGTIGVKHFVTFLLVLARVGGIFTSAPMFSNNHVAVQVRVVLSVALAFVLLPFAVGQVTTVPTDALPLATAVVKEVVVGILIGMVGLLLFTAVQVAAEIIDMQMGFGFAKIVDPMLEIQASVVAQFQNMLATLVFLVSNAHYLVLRGLADSFTALPVGAMALGGTVVNGFSTLFGQLFVAALKIGGPIVGILLLTEIALGVLARTVPQLNIFVLGFPVKIIVGMLTVLLVVPMLYLAMQGLFAEMPGTIAGLVRALGGGG